MSTAAPIRVQLSRAKGWRMPPDTVVVSRPGPWGNPFNLKASVHCWTAVAHGFRGDARGRQEASVAMFRAWVVGQKPAEVSGCGLHITTPGKPDVMVCEAPAIRAPAPPTLAAIRAALAGNSLACWCALPAPGEPDVCHAAVLLEIANADDPEPLPEPLPPKTENRS